MTTDIPKKIKLIVNKGQDLQLYNPTKVVKSQSKKWRVLFIGVVEKMATAKVESDTGNPEWLCEITVTSKNSRDPISMLVTDSKGRHIGQVVIPLKGIPPKPLSSDQPNGRPPLLLSNIFKSELEPTKKNSHPQGYLYYWMWTEDYWRQEDIHKIKIKKSLTRSMQNLSNSTLNLFRRKQSTASHQGSGDGNSICNSGNPFDNYSESGVKVSPVKVNQLKSFNQKSRSDTSASAYNSQISSFSGTISNSTLSNGYHNSTNPFDCLATTVDISIENNISLPERFDPNNEESLSHKASLNSKESPVSYKQRFGFYNKFRGKKSKSSLDLSKMNTELETRPEIVQPQSLGKHQGSRLFEKKNDASKSTLDLNMWFCGDNQLGNNLNIDVGKKNRPQSCIIQSGNEGTLFMNQIPSTSQNETSADNYNFSKPPIINRNSSLLSYAVSYSNLFENNYEKLNKNELIEKIKLMENALKDSMTKLRVSENEVVKSRNDKKALQEELTTVRDELCKLKCNLLEAGETKYLEKMDC